MVAMWLLCGYYVVAMCLVDICCYVVVMQLLCGCNVVVMWLICGCYVVVLWLLCGCYVVSIWL